ncbi:MAG: ComEC/Rec2 family competence protein [Aggregatilineales bacterium]
MTVTAHDQGNPISTALVSFKAHARDLFNQWLPSPQSALLTGIVLGIRTDLPTDVRNAFDQVNATRVLVIDGAKMAILIGLLTALLGKLRQKWLSAVLILGGVTVYTLFVGAQPPVVRAAIMGSLAIIAQRLGRESDGLSGLAFAIWLQTALDPAVINDAAFWISATSTLGLVVMAGPAQRRVDALLSRWFSRATVRFFGAVLIESFLVTLVVYVAALPVMLFVFGRFSPIGTLVNLLITPAQAPILALGLPAIALGSLIAPIGQILAWIASLPVSYTLSMVRAAAQMPNAALSVSITPVMVGAYYAIGFGLWLAAQRPAQMRIGWWTSARRLLTTPMVAAFGLSLAALLWALALARPDGRLHIWFLDVADSAVLIQTPGGAHILIDGGTAPNRLIGAIGDRLPFAVRSLDVLIVTEPKSSLISALPPTLVRYPVGVALTNGQPSAAAEAQALDTALITAQTRTIAVTAGYRLQTGDGVELDVLSPTVVPDAKAKPEDGALAVRLVYGNVSFMLTSDLTALTETTLIHDQYLAASVLELPSHGSDAANADNFLKAVAPQVAVIEVTTGVRAGQPADATLKRLGTIPIYRTDQSGTLTFVSDGQALWVSTER